MKTTRVIYVNDEIIRVTIKESTYLSKWFLKLFGYDGHASLWRTVYILPEHFSDNALINHELEHIRQIEREGKFKFSVKYLYFLVRYGYWNNPYEIQAREAE